VKSFINTHFNFFTFIHDTYRFCKNIELFPYNDHSLNQNKWPGLRSLEISQTEPFLFLTILEQAQNKLGLKTELYKEIVAFVHLRTEKDDALDWIHKDQCDTILVYLSESNLNSGTTFYTDQEEIILDLRFLQNASVFFDGNISHKSRLNYGNSLENSRMTLNIFCYKK
jgi:hypothetical protein